jgi:F0F1-type ATP synthase membrane subunit b/b'
MIYTIVNISLQYVGKFGYSKGFKMELDSVIIWVNLLIVVLLLVKFTAKPLMDFFKRRKKDKAADISHLEAEKEKISEEVANTIKMIDEKKALLADTEDNIIKQGKEIKAGIIREAETESIQILDKAARETEQEVEAAAEKLRNDVINEIFNKQQTTKKKLT